MHIRCPHCNNPIELVDDASLSDLSCPSCGSGFNILGDETIKVDGFAGDSIGHFTLSEKLGIGAFGTVWKANDTELDRTVAIKIPRKDQLDAEESEQFLREARALAQLKHPHIVSVHEVGRDAGRVYIVSDYIDGITLADWLTGQKPTPNESAEFCQKIAEALRHAHEQGVIHRDLKPGNIMLDKQNEPHIMDFGLAKREAGEITMTVEGKILGTPAYMSPEQARGEGHDADARSDIYSLGVILYELLTGEKPFRGNQRMLLNQVLYDEPKVPHSLNDRIPKDLETICLKCMEKDPEKRYQSSLKVAEELSRFQNNEPIQARPIGRIERWRRWGKRNPLVASLSASVILTLLIGTAVSSYFAIETNAALAVAIDANKKKDQALEAKAKALIDATEANEKKDQALEEKETALNETRKTIDKYVETVQNAELLKEERFKPLMKELLKDAMEHYQNFIEKHEHDDAELNDLSKVLSQVGRLSNRSGDANEAIDAYRKTIEIREILVAKYPSVSKYRYDLAGTHLRLGELHEATGLMNEALISYGNALKFYRKLASENPSLIEYRNRFAGSHNHLGVVYQAAGKTNKALSSYLKALELREKLIAENPKLSKYRYDIATTHNNLGNLYLATGRTNEARTSFGEALEFFRTLVAENPTVTDYRLGLSATYSNLAGLYKSMQKPKEALASYRKALELGERLTTENPTVTVYRSDLARVHHNIGLIYQEARQTDEAFTSYLKAMELQERLVEENPTVTAFRFGLAGTYNNLGTFYQAIGQANEALAKYQKALTIRERLAVENPENIKISIDLGGSYVNMAQLAQAQKEFDEANEYAELGVKMLTKVIRSNPRHPTGRLFLRNAHWVRAGLMDHQKRYDEAVKSWEKAIEYDSGQLKTQLQQYRDSASAKAKLQKRKKKKKPKRQTGNEKKSDEYRVNPLISPRPKLGVSKSKVRNLYSGIPVKRPFFGFCTPNYPVLHITQTATVYLTRRQETKQHFLNVDFRLEAHKGFLRRQRTCRITFFFAWT